MKSYDVVFCVSVCLCRISFNDNGNSNKKFKGIVLKVKFNFPTQLCLSFVTLLNEYYWFYFYRMRLRRLKSFDCCKIYITTQQQNERKFFIIHTFVMCCRSLMELWVMVTKPIILFEKFSLNSLKRFFH